MYYSVIADGNHTDETVLRIAYKSNPAGLFGKAFFPLSILLSLFKGIVLVTDAIAAMGLGEGVHKLGTMTVEVKSRAARLLGHDTLAGRYVCTCIPTTMEVEEVSNCHRIKLVKVVISKWRS